MVLLVFFAVSLKAFRWDRVLFGGFEESFEPSFFGTHHSTSAEGGKQPAKTFRVDSGGGGTNRSLFLQHEDSGGPKLFLFLSLRGRGTNVYFFLKFFFTLSKRWIREDVYLRFI